MNTALRLRLNSIVADARREKPTVKCDYCVDAAEWVLGKGAIQGWVSNGYVDAMELVGNTAQLGYNTDGPTQLCSEHARDLVICLVDMDNLDGKLLSDFYLAVI